MIVESGRVALQLVASMRHMRWSSNEIRKFQERALLKSLRHAVAHVPYYRSLRPEIGEIRGARDLARFPILTKSLMQQHRMALLADGRTLDTLKVSLTSGSTGEPTATAFDSRTWALCKYALKVRRLLTYGIGIGKRVLLVSEMSPQELESSRSLLGAGVLFGQRYISIHQPIADALDQIAEYRPNAIYGFPSFFGELLDVAKDSSRTLPKVDVVFTSSEVLHPGLRTRMEKTFHARVCDVYGNTEFKEVAWQCPAGRYHLNFESTWLETVDIADDGFGTVLLTSLVNRAMPLIRYRVGDRVKPGGNTCTCGRSGPWLDSVSGREVEMLEMPDGSRISPYLLTSLIELDPAVRKYQIRQASPSRLDVLYIGSPNQEVDRSTMLSSLDSVLRGRMGVRFCQVDAIPRTPRGKQKVFLREFEPDCVS